MEIYAFKYPLITLGENKKQILTSLINIHDLNRLLQIIENLQSIINQTKVKLPKTSLASRRNDFSNASFFLPFHD